VNLPLYLTLAIALVALALLISDRVRPDMVALLVIVALGITGILTPREAFSGLSRGAVITIMAIFILAEGLARTGLIERAGDVLLRVAGRREAYLVLVVMAAGAGLSLVMNNIAAAAVLLPAVSSAARKAGISPARLYMPLAFSTLLGGTATLLTTTNIMVGSLLRDEGLAGYGLLDFAPVGLPLVAAGIAYMVLWGRNRLPAHMPERWPDVEQREGDDLLEVYRLDERLFRARVPAGSALIGKPLARSAFREGYNLTVLAIERAGRVVLAPVPETILQVGDVVLLEGKLDEFLRLDTEPQLEVLPPRNWRRQDLESAAVVVVEAVLAPRSGLLGRTLRTARFREKYGMVVLAIWRAGRPIRTALGDQPLQFGDALLLQGARERLPLLRTEPDLIVLDASGAPARPAYGRRWLVLAILGVTLVAAALSATLVSEIMLAGALALVAARVLTLDEAYQAIEWKSVFLVAGLLPLGVAMTKTGAAALLARTLIDVLGPAGPLALLAGLVVLAALLTQAMYGAAVATVVTPMAIEAARQIGADPRALAMGVALATSLAFLTPLGHPVNVLVMGPGGYRFRDYLRVGLPLTLILLAVMLALLPLLWPLGR